MMKSIHRQSAQYSLHAQHTSWREYVHTWTGPSLVHGVSDRHVGLGVGWCAPLPVCRYKATSAMVERDRGRSDAMHWGSTGEAVEHGSVLDIIRWGVRILPGSEQHTSCVTPFIPIQPQNGWAGQVRRRSTRRNDSGEVNETCSPPINRATGGSAGERSSQHWTGLGFRV